MIEGPALIIAMDFIALLLMVFICNMFVVIDTLFTLFGLVGFKFNAFFGKNVVTRRQTRHSGTVLKYIQMMILVLVVTGCVALCLLLFDAFMSPQNTPTFFSSCFVKFVLQWNGD